MVNNIEIVGRIRQEGQKYICNLMWTKHRKISDRWMDIEIPSTLDYGNNDPILINDVVSLHDLDIRLCKKNRYLYKYRIIDVDKNSGLSQAELMLRIKHIVLKEEKELSRIKKEIQAFENLSEINESRREQIPESVRLFVWQRDGGQCVKCGSNEKLEFDHIIPVIKGGSNTERNIQLLCESCNRSKGANLN